MCVFFRAVCPMWGVLLLLPLLLLVPHYLIATIRAIVDLVVAKWCKDSGGTAWACQEETPNLSKPQNLAVIPSLNNLECILVDRIKVLRSPLSTIP